MSFIPQDEVKGYGPNLAPMIDFLFLMLIFFASLAISRATTKDTQLSLVEIKSETSAPSTLGNMEFKVINISINEKGEFFWITEIRDYLMPSPQDLTKELLLQHQKHLLPEDKSKTQVLLKIDKNATWEPILKAIFAIRDAGFEVRPVYEPENLTFEKPTCCFTFVA